MRCMVTRLHLCRLAKRHDDVMNRSLRQVCTCGMQAYAPAGASRLMQCHPSMFCKIWHGGAGRQKVPNLTASCKISCGRAGLARVSSPPGRGLRFFWAGKWPCCASPLHNLLYSSFSRCASVALALSIAALSRVMFRPAASSVCCLRFTLSAYRGASQPQGDTGRRQHSGGFLLWIIIPVSYAIIEALSAARSTVHADHECAIVQLRAGFFLKKSWQRRLQHRSPECCICRFVVRTE